MAQMFYAQDCNLEYLMGKKDCHRRLWLAGTRACAQPARFRLRRGRRAV